MTDATDLTWDDLIRYAEQYEAGEEHAFVFTVEMTAEAYQALDERYQYRLARYIRIIVGSEEP